MLKESKIETEMTSSLKAQSIPVNSKSIYTPMLQEKFNDSIINSQINRKTLFCKGTKKEIKFILTKQFTHQVGPPWMSEQNR